MLIILSKQNIKSDKISILVTAVICTLVHFYYNYLTYVLYGLVDAVGIGIHVPTYLEE